MLVSQTLKTRSLAQSYAIETNGAYGPPLRNHPLFLTLWSFQGLRVGLLRLPCFKSIDVYKLLGDIGRCFRGSFYFPSKKACLVCSAEPPIHAKCNNNHRKRAAQKYTCNSSCKKRQYEKNNRKTKPKYIQEV